MQDLIFFVHVGKTGGSALNKLLHQHDPNGVEHCETIIDDPERFSEAANTRNWLSGHVPIHQAEKALSGVTNRNVKYFSLLRHPVAQIASHYNFLMEIFFRGERFYSGTHPRVKEISEALRASDNSDERVIMKNLARFHELFLNYQSTYFIDKEFKWQNPNKDLGQTRGDLSDVLRSRYLSKFAGIEDEKDLKKLFKVMTGQRTNSKFRANAATYRFPKEIFWTPNMMDFIGKNNAKDNALYETVTGRRYDAKPRRLLESLTQWNPLRRAGAR